MTDFTHLFTKGQKVYYKNEDFDAIHRIIPCIVKEIYKDHMIITDIETDTDLYIEEGFNLSQIYPDYNFDMDYDEK